MEKITDNMLPGRWDASRGPPTGAEVSSTSVLRVRIESGEFEFGFYFLPHIYVSLADWGMGWKADESTASAKIRTGGPSDDRKDLNDKELVKKTWTGVVPYWGTWGEPVEGKDNGCAEVEPYIEQWRQKETGKARTYAFDAISIDGKKK
jgi:hypothetical protein